MGLDLDKASWEWEWESIHVYFHMKDIMSMGDVAM